MASRSWHTALQSGDARVVPAAEVRGDSACFIRSPGAGIICKDRCRVAEDGIDDPPLRLGAILSGKKSGVADHGVADQTFISGHLVRRAVEREKDDLLREKEMLLEEMRHRIANSLQIIASILLLKARTVQSEETRRHLQDAHQRVMSVATVQEQLRGTGHGDLIEIGPYLTKLCDSLAKSMIGSDRSIRIARCICRGLLQLGSKTRGLAAITHMHRARDVATLSRLRL